MTTAILALTISFNLLSTGQRALPPVPPFPVTAPDGTVVEGRGALPSGRLLLVQLVPDTDAARRFADALREWWSPAFNGRVVLLLLGDTPAAARFVQERLQSVDLRWFADPEGAAWRALGFQGNLAVAGVADRAIDWKVDGVVNNPSAVEHAVRAWMERTP